MKVEIDKKGCEHKDVEQFGGKGLSFCYCHNCKSEVTYQQAVKLGRLSVEHARGLLPYREVNHDVLRLLDRKPPQIEHAETIT